MKALNFNWGFSDVGAATRVACAGCVGFRAVTYFRAPWQRTVFGSMINRKPHFLSLFCSRAPALPKGGFAKTHFLSLFCSRAPALPKGGFAKTHFLSLFCSRVPALPKGGFAKTHFLSLFCSRVPALPKGGFAKTHF